MSGPTLRKPISLGREASGKKWSLIEVFSLRVLRNGPGYTINNYIYSLIKLQKHVIECLAILAESGSETTSEALKIQNFPGCIILVSFPGSSQAFCCILYKKRVCDENLGRSMGMRLHYSTNSTCIVIVLFP